MESKYQNVDDLISISEFISEKRTILKYLVSEIKFNQVNTVLRFNKTLNRIREILSQPLIQIGKPQIVKREILETPYTLEHQLKGIPINKFLVTVKFPIKGSNKLLRFKPENFSFEIKSNMKIYKPTFDEIYVEVKTPDLDKSNVISGALLQINFTEQFVSKINIEIEKWNRELEEKIEPLVLTRKKELEELFK